MARRFFRKIVPSEQTMREIRTMRLFGTTLLNRRLWHLNRHSTAWGVACGLFWAWILLPAQTIAAVACAILGRGNVALAMAFTWVSNPLTMLPCFVVSYYVGLFVTGAEPVHGLKDQMHEAMEAGLVEGVVISCRLLWQNLPQLYPLYVGGIVVGTVSALAGYAAVKLTWRWNIARRWKHRHDTRRGFNPALRISSGFAHLHRLAGRARPAS